MTKKKPNGNKSNQNSEKAVAKTKTNKKQKTVEDDIDIKLKTVKFSDFDTDDNGVPTSVFGIVFEKLFSNQIRKICTEVGIRSFRNLKKGDMIESLKDGHHNWKTLSDEADNKEMQSVSNPRKQPQCSFCLLNVLFSDAIVDDFANLGDPNERDVIDVGLAAFDQHFWEKVRHEFIHRLGHGELQFTENKHISKVANTINPGKILQHPWKKLRTIWIQVNKVFKECNEKFRKSGSHDSDFFNFCPPAWLDVFHLFLHLKLKPDLTTMVLAALPEDAQLSSVKTESPQSDDPTKTPRKSKLDSVVAAVRDLGEQLAQSSNEASKTDKAWLQKEKNLREQAFAQVQLVAEEAVKRTKESKKRTLEMQRQTNELAKKRLFDQVMEVENKLEAQEEKLKKASREDKKKSMPKLHSSQKCNNNCRWIGMLATRKSFTKKRKNEQQRSTNFQIISQLISVSTL